MVLDSCLKISTWPRVAYCQIQPRVKAEIRNQIVDTVLIARQIPEFSWPWISQTDAGLGRNTQLLTLDWRPWNIYILTVIQIFSELCKKSNMVDTTIVYYRFCTTAQCIIGDLLQGMHAAQTLLFTGKTCIGTWQYFSQSYTGARSGQGSAVKPQSHIVIIEPDQYGGHGPSRTGPSRTTKIDKNVDQRPSPPDPTPTRTTPDRPGRATALCWHRAGLRCHRAGTVLAPCSSGVVRVATVSPPCLVVGHPCRRRDDPG